VIYAGHQQCAFIIRREIEALIAASLVKAFIGQFGRGSAVQVTDEVIQSLAVEAGRGLREVTGGRGLEHLERMWGVFAQLGILNAGGCMDYHGPPQVARTEAHVPRA
jgi:hypothetical protein